jgi:hypothetical protein
MQKHRQPTKTPIVRKLLRPTHRRKMTLRQVMMRTMKTQNRAVVAPATVARNPTRSRHLVMAPPTHRRTMVMIPMVRAAEMLPCQQKLPN